MRREDKTAELMAEHDVETSRKSDWVTATFRLKYDARIIPIFGGIVEDMRDAGYEIPQQLEELYRSGIVNASRMEDLTRVVATAAVTVRSRRLRPTNETRSARRRQPRTLLGQR